jgi:hypothetical protein
VKLVQALQKYGLIPNKTPVAYAPDELKENRHFWRGVIDGDGYVGIPGGRPVLTLVACRTAPLIHQFANFVRERVRTVAKVRSMISKKDKLGSVLFTITDSFACSIMQLLYKDVAVALPRKLATAQLCFAEGGD